MIVIAQITILKCHDTDCLVDRETGDVHELRDVLHRQASYVGLHSQVAVVCQEDHRVEGRGRGGGGGGGGGGVQSVVEIQAGLQDEVIVGCLEEREMERGEGGRWREEGEGREGDRERREGDGERRERGGREIERGGREMERGCVAVERGGVEMKKGGKEIERGERE